MNAKIYKMAAGLAVVLAVLMMFDTATAQRRREVRGRKLTKAQVKLIINRVEDRTDNFVKNLDRSLDNSRLNGSMREDTLNQKAKALENATDELSREFDRRGAWIENRDEVRKCLNIASDLDRSVRNRRYGAATESNWAKVRFELNSLADAYNMPKVGAAAYR